jgi:CDP-diacylglycerol--glycerol-3-phosphate 3-phosphatidyltransferase
LAVGHFGFAAIFATISGLLDSVDGMVARMSGVASDAGEILDAVIDRYVEFFFLSALVIYYREIPILQAAALLALLGSFMVTYSTTKAEALGLMPPRGSMRRPERAVYLTLGATLSTVSIPLLETPAESSNPIGYPMAVALVLVAVAANISSIRRFWSIAKAVRVREKDFAGDKSNGEKIPIEEHEAATTKHRATGLRL